ncbi:putative odorant receptor 92a [Drosophila willistoni]|uniref:putative odorant receptor 92a n=1 Tax=Drosophila willistoni TaxID=7260 RepID=UPI001F07C63F|nr:putative odorant receptor 92a [Drosophila willistoni]
MEKLLKVLQRLRPSNVTNGQIGSIDLNIWLGQLAGLPLIGVNQEAKCQRIGQQILGFLMLIALFCYVSLEIYDLKRSWTNLDMMTQNLVMTLTHLGYWFKVINTYFNYESIKQIINKLRRLTRDCVVSVNQQRTFYETEAKSKLVMIMYCHLITVPPIMALFMIMFAPEGFAGERFPFRLKTPEFLPPFLQHLYMGLCLVYISAGLSVLDILHVLFMNQICLHLKILNLAFEEFTSIQSKGHILKRSNSQMMSIVKYHCKLIVLRQEMEKVYRLPVMFQFISSLIIVAMTAFQAIVGDVSQSTFLMDFLLTCVIVQLFIYCWYGNEVFEQSKTLSTSGFGCDWHKFDSKFKRLLLIFMINAERPFLFTAGGFMGLTLASFTNIMGKSYSIVAVLRQVYSRSQ